MGYVLQRESAPRHMPIPRQTFDQVRVRVTRSHYQLRRLVEAGEVIELPEPEAATAVALGRAERA